MRTHIGDVSIAGLSGKWQLATLPRRRQADVTPTSRRRRADVTPTSRPARLGPPVCCPFVLRHRRPIMPPATGFILIR